MNRAILPTVCGLLLPFVGACAAPNEAALDPAHVQVAVAFDRGAVTPLIVEGVADRESGRAVAANDPVRVASISKLIMALAALRLSQEGVVDLDADVSTYLNWPVRAPGFPDDPVTLRQLLSHRSGLRDKAGYVVALGESLEDKLAEPDAWYSELPPGDAPFEYANLGSPLVASVLEAASGERFDVLIERTVFGPLEIDACFNWVGCSQERISRAVVLYRDTGEIARDDAKGLPPNCTIPVVDGKACDLSNYVPGTNGSIFSPQGGLRIGMVDLAKIGQALINEGAPLLDAATFQAMIASAEVRLQDQEFFCSYGLGLQKIEVGPDSGSNDCVDDLFTDGRARWGHPGEAYGLRSGLWLDPQSGEGIAYFITAVPPRTGAEDEGGFDRREFDLIDRVQAILQAPVGNPASGAN